MTKSASRYKTHSIAALVIASGLGLGACDTVQEAMGLGKLPPDEMAVAPRRPLAMPPDYNLRPPQPGAASPADVNTGNAAARALATSGEGAAAPAEPPATPASGDGRTMTTTPPPAEPQ